MHTFAFLMFISYGWLAMYIIDGQCEMEKLD